jgi:RNA polymerase-binding transcription factor
VKLEAIRKDLLARKQEIEEKLNELYRDNYPTGHVQDTGDQALAATLEELKISLHNTELEEYHRIIKALQMIDSGSYGICIECGLPISEKRLKMFPNTTRCLVCQEAIEEKGPEY